MKYDGISEESLTQELRKIFQESASGIVDQMTAALAAPAGNSGALELVYRLSHSLKGSSLQLGFDEFGQVATAIEALAMKLRSQANPPAEGLASLTEGAACLRRLLDCMDRELPPEDPEDICRRLEALAE